MPFLAVLPAQTLEGLAAQATRVELPAGAVLFTRGDDGDSFYTLEAGRLEIDLPEGAKVEEAPGYVGEIALLRDIPRTATVRALRARRCGGSAAPRSSTRSRGMPVRRRAPTVSSPRGSDPCPSPRGRHRTG